MVHSPTAPDTALTVPWETCTTVGEKFSFHYTDHFKSGRELVHLLLNVVSKGGNLALNLAPQPDGELPAPAVRSLREMGAWLALFGEGIYGTRICAPYFEDRLFYTQKEGELFVFFRYDELPRLPDRLTLHLDRPVRQAHCMRTGEALHFRAGADGLTLDLRQLPMGGAFYAEGFRLTLAD